MKSKHAESTLTKSQDQPLQELTAVCFPLHKPIATKEI